MYLVLNKWLLQYISLRCYLNCLRFIFTMSLYPNFSSIFNICGAKSSQVGGDIWGLWQSSKVPFLTGQYNPWEGHAKVPSPCCEANFCFSYIEFIMPSEICIFCFAKLDWGSKCPKYPVRICMPNPVGIPWISSISTHSSN